MNIEVLYRQLKDMDIHVWIVPSAWPVSTNASNSSRCLVAESQVSTAHRGAWRYSDPPWEPRGGGEEEASQERA